MKKYLERFLDEKGVIVVGDLSRFDKLSAPEKRIVKNNIIKLDFVNAPIRVILEYLDSIR